LLKLRCFTTGVTPPFFSICDQLVQLSAYSTLAGVPSEFLGALKPMLRLDRGTTNEEARAVYLSCIPESDISGQVLIAGGVLSL
jgi:hypothetical protein